MAVGIATFGSGTNSGIPISGSFGGGTLPGPAPAGGFQDTATTSTQYTQPYNEDYSIHTGVLGDSTYNQQYAAQQAAAREAALANQFVDQQVGNLNDLFGRTQTGLDQGLSQLNDSYNSNVTAQNNALAQANQDYSDKRVATNKDKLGAYGTINKNANNGYRSLAQIIGRASGTGSSAFREALPDAIGRETSGKRTDANQTYATNMGNIDTAQKKTELSFQEILRDLANQRSNQEQSLRSGVEGQRQSILAQKQQLEAQRGNLAGAQALQGQIEGSRNSVESFFNQFKPTLTAQQAAIGAPDVSKYTVDRANVNAQAQGGNVTNPYADMLRKKLQEQA